MCTVDVIIDSCDHNILTPPPTLNPGPNLAALVYTAQVASVLPRIFTPPSSSFTCTGDRQVGSHTARTGGSTVASPAVDLVAGQTTVCT